MNAALALLVITFGFALAVPVVLGVWGNPRAGVELVAQRVLRVTPLLRRRASDVLAQVLAALIVAGRALWLLVIALLVVARASIIFLETNFVAGVGVLRSRMRPVAGGLSMRRSTLREPAPSKPLASSRLAFAVIVYGTAFAVLIILTIRWVTAALEGIVS